MRFFPRHPHIDELTALARAAVGAPHTSAAAHVDECRRCRARVRLLRSVDDALEEAPVPGPSRELRARVLAARARGERTILPLESAAPRRRRHRLLPLAAAAVVVTFGGVLLTRSARVVEGSAAAGTLSLDPALPRPGGTVRVRYLPEEPLARERWLVLRSRERTADDPSYNLGRPVTRLAVLRRASDGSFAGSFVLPDSIVYAALAVEDSSAGIIDDDGGRDWEVLVAGGAGGPGFESLNQRAQDLMGRNWEEGFATARRMTALYPNEVRAWLWLRAFQGWLGRGDDDSVVALHRAKLGELRARAESAGAVSDRELGFLAWYAGMVDTAAARRWRASLLRKAPDNSFAVQWRLLDAMAALDRSHDTTTALRGLDSMWRAAPADRAEQVATFGTAVALGARDSSAILRWTSRLIPAARDGNGTARWVADRLAEIPALRQEGMRRIRSQLAALDALPDEERALGETRDGQRIRHAALQRGRLASLGRALVASGARTAGLDTLARAAAAGWDLDVFRAVRVAALAAGDTTTALSMAAREVVDPRTDAPVADSLRRLAESRIGAPAWRARLARARGELVDRVLVSGRTRSLAAGGAARLLDRSLVSHALRDVVDGNVTIVAFWSRFCGPAIEDLPRLNAVATRLARDGVRVIGIVDETSPSPELNEFLYERKVTIPTYLDAWHEASRAFNQWGTPYYYVLDPAGRIRFDVVTSADEALLRAEALRLSLTATALGTARREP